MSEETELIGATINSKCEDGVWILYSWKFYHMDNNDKIYDTKYFNTY